MTQDKIIKILKEKSIETSAKEIYKLHLEAQLELLIEKSIWIDANYLLEYNRYLNQILE